MARKTLHRGEGQCRAEKICSEMEALRQIAILTRARAGKMSLQRPMVDARSEEFFRRGLHRMMGYDMVV
jgi:hypothetical protein